jgi:hypothetical protein
MRLTLEEMETAFYQNAANRGEWQVNCDDPVMQRKLESIGAELIHTSADGGFKQYKLKASQIRFRREMTEEERVKLSQRFKKPPT